MTIIAIYRPLVYPVARHTFRYRLRPARAGWNAVLDLLGRNIRAGTAILILNYWAFMQSFALVLLVIPMLFVVSCGGAAEVKNANTGTNFSNQGASNGFKPVGNADLPEGLRAEPIQPSGSATPGIPDPKNAVNAVPKGATPTPGIPDPKSGNRQIKPGATPTPGIPSEEELRKMLKRPASNVNTPPRPPSGDSMMRKRRPGESKPR